MLTKTNNTGEKYIKTPKDIAKYRAIVNVKCKDNSFKWAVLSAIYPANKLVDRKSSYKKYENKLIF